MRFELLEGLRQRLEVWFSQVGGSMYPFGDLRRDQQSSLSGMGIAYMCPFAWRRVEHIHQIRRDRSIDDVLPFVGGKTDSGAFA